MTTVAAGARAADDVPGQPAPAAAEVQQVSPSAGAPDQPAPVDHPQLAPPRSVYDQAFDDAVKKATQGWLEDPFKHIGADMSLCHDRLAEFKTDQPVQQRQDQVVERLNTVIAMLEKECSGGAGGGANPTKPLGRSLIAKGPGGQGDMHDPKQGEKRWADLPPKQREQILQSKTEGFPPGFEAVLQSYYERLAQEQLDDGAGGNDAVGVPAAAEPQGATE
jgi:hypothetical protein